MQRSELPKFGGASCRRKDRPELPAGNWIERCYHGSLIVVVRWAEKILGGGSLFWAALPWSIFEILRRRRDYHYFGMLRRTLPLEFWRGKRSFRHFLRMIVHWQGTLCACLLYDRLDDPAWRNRIRLEGTPPEQLPGWGSRPVVLVFLHTGGSVLAQLEHARIAGPRKKTEEDRVAVNDRRHASS